MKKALIFLLLISLHTASMCEIHKLLKQPAALNATDLQEYVGVYTFTTPGSPITKFQITEKEGELYGEADSYGANKLLKQSEADKFVSTSSYGSTIIFVRQADTKQITGLQLIIEGNTLEATKEK